MKNKLKEIKIILGPTASGKTIQLVDEYCEKSKKFRSVFLSCDCDSSAERRIPIQNINATASFICYNDDYKQDLKAFTETVNNFVEKENIEYIFIDGLISVISDSPNPNDVFNMTNDLGCNVYLTYPQE